MQDSCEKGAELWNQPLPPAPPLLDSVSSLGCLDVITVLPTQMETEPSPSLQVVFRDHQEIILILSRWASEFNTVKNMAFTDCECILKIKSTNVCVMFVHYRPGSLHNRHTRYKIKQMDFSNLVMFLVLWCSPSIYTNHLGEKSCA